MEADLLESLPDPGDLGEDFENLADPGEDWVSLFLENSEEFDTSSLGDLLFQDEQQPQVPLPLTGSPPSSGVTDQSSKGEDDGAGSGTEQPEKKPEKKIIQAEPSSSEDSNTSGSTGAATTSKRLLGKRKSDVHGFDEEKPQDDGEVDEEEVKRRARLMRNRESAQLSRQRKKAYVDDLEERVRGLNSTVAELNNTISLISAENVNLRNQLAYYYHQQNGGGVTPVKPGGFAPPIGVPVYPYPGGYMMRACNSSATAPPVPIPRLKTQATAKSVKRAKVCKEESKKPVLGSGSATSGAPRTKKLASVAAVGFLCIMALVLPFDFGGPRVAQVSPSGWGSGLGSGLGSGSVSSRVGGRVLMSLESNETSRSSEELEWRLKCEGYNDGKLGCGGGEIRRAVIDGSVFPANVSFGNSSHRVPASLLLPRDDRVVKVDGDLIIQAVLAGDEAGKQKPAAAQSSGSGSSSPPALLNSGVLRDIAAKTLNRVEKHRALPAGGNQTSEQQQEDLDDSQRKVLNDLADTVFSTGMCTEVFQFELSGEKSPGGEAAAAPPVKRRNQHRRSLLPVAAEELKQKKGNSTAGKNSSSSSSSMVVSVFNSKQPHNSGAGAKDLARIFVVVLVDSVKYVTYSCLLPPQPQVVTG